MKTNIKTKRPLYLIALVTFVFAPLSVLADSRVGFDGNWQTEDGRKFALEESDDGEGLIWIPAGSTNRIEFDANSSEPGTYLQRGVTDVKIRFSSMDSGKLHQGRSVTAVSRIAESTGEPDPGSDPLLLFERLASSSPHQPETTGATPPPIESIYNGRWQMEDGYVFEIRNADSEGFRWVNSNGEPDAIYSRVHGEPIVFQWNEKAGVKLRFNGADSGTLDWFGTPSKVTRLPERKPASDHPGMSRNPEGELQYEDIRELRGLSDPIPSRFLR